MGPEASRDGGDEWASPRTCPNTCAELAREAFGALERSCQTQAEMIRFGRDAAVDRAEQLAKARKDVLEQSPQLDVFRETRDAAEKEEAAELAARKARLEAGEVATALHLNDLTVDMAVHALSRLALSRGVDGVDKLYDALAAHDDLKDLMEDVQRCPPTRPQLSSFQCVSSSFPTHTHHFHVVAVRSATG